MLCPVCKTTNLVMTERQAIEIDYCPQCRGVWLDRGELDKIIERTVPEVAPVAAAAAPRAAEPARTRDPRAEYRDHEREYDRDRDHKRHDEYRSHYEHKSYKKKSLLGELFDF